MKNQTNLIKRIRNIIVGNTLPANEDLWLDTSNGEKNAVLKYKGNPISSNGNGNQPDPGYTITKSYTVIDEETITTVDHGGYNNEVFTEALDIVIGDTYKVTFNGTEYTCVAFDNNGAPSIGTHWIVADENYDFSEYPFNIQTFSVDEGEYVTILTTESAGDYSVKIEHLEEVVEPTEDFKAAVDSVTGYSIDEEYETLYDGTVETEGSNGDFYGIITPTITFVLGDTYKVTFNGTEYTCKCFDSNDNLYIGAPYIEDIGCDFSTYPFNITTFDADGVSETQLCTNQEGSCTLKIEHLTTSTKTTSEFESMIQGIAGSGSSSGCQIIYPDYIRWSDGLYSQYNNEPEAGNIYFIPFSDNGSPYNRYLYPVHIDGLTNNNNQFSGSATIIGTPIIVDNGTLTVQPFDHMINPGESNGLCIEYNENNNNYRLYYGGAPLG